MSTIDYKLETKDVGKQVKAIQEAFKRKRDLEAEIAGLIKQFERETDLAIDAIKYQRDITLPVRSSRYTDLTIIILSEDFK